MYFIESPYEGLASMMRKLAGMIDLTFSVVGGWKFFSLCRSSAGQLGGDEKVNKKVASPLSDRSNLIAV